MRKEARFGAFIFAVIILCAGLSMASFTYKQNSIETSYSGGEAIRGTLKIGITNEPTSAVFSSNFNGSISLIDLLEKTGLVEGEDYNCSRLGCLDSYETGEDKLEVFTINEGTDTRIGFEVFGSNMEINSLKFSINSNADKSCSSPLIMDVLDKGEYFIQSNKYSEETCGDEITGCFDSGADSVRALITTDYYCEKMNLENAPGYQIGATVRNGTESDDLTMTLQSIDGDILGDCILPKQTETTERLGCIVNYSSIESKDYLVCISSGSEDSGFKIETETEAPRCGTSTSGEPYDIDFDVFALPLKFEPIGTFEVNEDLFYEMSGGQGLVSYVDNYIAERYERDCSKGCIIPFKISGVSQTLTLADAEISYNKGSTALLSEEMYPVTRIDARVYTTAPVDLEMSYAGFTVPVSSKASKLYLYFGNKAILPNPLNITIVPSFSFDITPKTVLLGVETNFQAVTTSKIVSSNWDFGDGTTGKSSGKFVSHRYMPSEKESYTVVVDLTRSDGVKARNSFIVSTGSLRESADKLVAEYENRIVNITNKMDSFPAFIATALKSKINLTEMQSLVSTAKANLANATGDEDYSDVINELSAAKIPASLAVSEEGKSIPMEIGFGNIDVSYLEEISGTKLNSAAAKDEVKGKIVSWFDKNYAGAIDYEIISGVNNFGGQTPILTKVKVTITKKAEADASASEANLIIGYPKSELVFAGDYLDKTVTSGVYIPVGDSKTIEFIVYDGVSAASLGMYISPEMSKLGGFSSLVEISQAGGFNWGRFWWGMFIILILAFVIYIALQEWYKRKYEAYLFKNPADLYNTITFVHNSRKNGLDDAEIAKKLKNAGWKGEQTAYSFKKLDGKRTGMLEIPIFRFFEKKKIEQEIEKRRNPQQIPQVASTTTGQADRQKIY